MSNNYTYIIASMPVLTPAYKPENGSTASVMQWIESQLSAKDNAKLALVREGFVPASLNADFYHRAFAAKDGFTAQFFAADLALRNAKVDYLNQALGRPEGTDRIDITDAPAFEGHREIAAIFAIDNLLERERAIDDFLWRRIDDLTLMITLSLENILAIAAKLCIIERWLALDEKTGRELLAKFVKDLRGSYGDINFENFR